MRKLQVCFPGWKTTGSSDSSIPRLEIKDVLKPKEEIFHHELEGVMGTDVETDLSFIFIPYFFPFQTLSPNDF